LEPRSVAATAGVKVRVLPLEAALRPANRLSVVRLQEQADTGLVKDFVTALREPAHGNG
jgi:hypothetical protein